MRRRGHARPLAGPVERTKIPLSSGVAMIIRWGCEVFSGLMTPVVGIEKDLYWR